MAAKKKAAGKPAAKRASVGTPNVKGHRLSLDPERYAAMRAVLLKVLPPKGPGLTQAEMFAAADRIAPRNVFPDFGKVCWWAKWCQLDLETKGVVAREATKPLRWHKTGKA